jgi:diaminohydroxyphosphoribosylaminopyrimidine deaminase/5-amino-6-(5-phosphoribosylamino)uracil reductase
MKVPFKAVLDPDLKIPSNSYLIKNNPQKLIIFTSWRNKNRAGRLPIVAKIFFVKENNGSFDLKMVMRRLYDYGVMSVFIEGGSQTLGSFFDAKLVDKVYFFIAPKIIGGKSALPSVGGKGFASPDDVWLDDMRVQKIGEDVLVTGYPCYRK